MPVELTVDQKSLHALTRALRREEDGKALRRDLSREIRNALKPAVEEAKAGILAMPSAGLFSAEPGLRSSIASQITAQARLTGRMAGASVKAKKRRMPRGFSNAPQRTNRAAGWRHPVYGHDVWVHQIGRPGWFDIPMKRGAPRYREAVRRAMADSAERVARGARL